VASYADDLLLSQAQLLANIRGYNLSLGLTGIPGVDAGIQQQLADAQRAYAQRFPGTNELQAQTQAIAALTGGPAGAYVSEVAGNYYNAALQQANIANQHQATGGGQLQLQGALPLLLLGLGAFAFARRRR
jgi:hypothetical protein